MSTKLKVYILIGLIVVSIGLVVYISLSKKKKNENAEIISDAIAENVGVLGTDIDSLLVSTKIDSGYNTPKADLEKMKNADGGYFMTDKPDAFSEVFQGKTKARIKKVIADYRAAYGQKLNDHINVVFDDVTGYDTTRYDQLLNIIRNAA